MRHDELMHWKYVKKYKKNGKWQYVYDTAEQRNAAKEKLKTLRGEMDSRSNSIDANKFKSLDEMRNTPTDEIEKRRQQMTTDQAALDKAQLEFREEANKFMSDHVNRKPAILKETEKLETQIKGLEDYKKEIQKKIDALPLERPFEEDPVRRELLYEQYKTDLKRIQLGYQKRQLMELLNQPANLKLLGGYAKTEIKNKK